jgi:hypothetical protein
VIANLFYPGVVFRRAPRIGDTLRTVTEASGLRQNSRRAGRAATGLAALRMSTRDQDDRPVLDFWRCAMLPLRDRDQQTEHADDLSSIGGDPTAEELAQVGGGLGSGHLPGPNVLVESRLAGRRGALPRSLEGIRCQVRPSWR